MGQVKYCDLCDRMISTKKKWNWTAFLSCVLLSWISSVLVLMVMIPMGEFGALFVIPYFLVSGIIFFMYPLYYIFKDSDMCPICCNESLTDEDPSGNHKYVSGKKSNKKFLDHFVKK